MSTNGKFIYFIRPVGMIGPIKIGCSRSAGERLETLAVWSPFPLEIIYTEPGNYQLEQRIHRAFADYHSHREWFHPGERLLKAISKLQAGAVIATAIDFSQDNGAIRKSIAGKPRAAVLPIHVGMKSIQMQLIWAVKRAQKARGEPVWAPADIWRIMDRWKGTHYRQHLDAVRPTDAEFSRLFEVIHNPAQHHLTRSERWPEDPVNAAA